MKNFKKKAPFSNGTKLGEEGSKRVGISRKLTACAVS